MDKTTPDYHSEERLEPQPQEVALQEMPRRQSIGVVANYEHSDENRFLLTPESCAIIACQGYDVLLEAGAGIDIDFSDEAYAENGATIVDRDTALKADIVISFHIINARDIMKMRRGAALMCIMNQDVFDISIIQAALQQEITLGCLDNMYDHNEEFIFQTVLDDIDGRAAVIYAEQGLSYQEGGKGVLLGGAPGLLPCEVLIIGQGVRVWTAARAAMGRGANVTLMDNHVSSLQQGQIYCGEGLNTSVLHPRVLARRIATADVLIIDECTKDFNIPRELEETMKPNCYVLDFQETAPSMAVPRTVAMAMSNILVNFFEELQLKNNFSEMLASSPGVQNGIVTFRGRLTSKLIGMAHNMPVVDITMMLAATN